DRARHVHADQLVRIVDGREEHEQPAIRDEQQQEQPPLVSCLVRVRLERGEGWLLLLLLVAYGWLFVGFPAVNNPNELVRVYMARAIAEEGTYSIGVRIEWGGRLGDGGPIYSDWGYVNDKALVCKSGQPPYCAGKLYAAKAPG